MESNIDNSEQNTMVFKYNPLKQAKNSFNYVPALIIVKKKIYRVTNWKDAFKILMFFHCYKEDRIDEIKEEIDSTANAKSEYYIKSASSGMEENRFFAKFSPELYIRIFSTQVENYRFLNKIRGWIGDFDLYVLRYLEKEEDSVVLDTIENKINELTEQKKFKTGSTRHLLASINARVLSPKEKFYIRVNNEFDKSVLIGDISITDSEEEYLRQYMKDCLSFMLKNHKMYYHDKVFAFGMVRVALKYYASKTFWPFVKEEYGVPIPGNDQSIINQAFKSTLLKYNKLYYGEESDYVQNMCMHTFVCDKCANQLFNYIFEFWRIDLSRSIENIKDDDNNDLFDILVEEIEKNENTSVQDIMIHTTMALKANPIGSKNRIRRILKMIDDSYWNNTNYSESQNRISRLFNEWKNNKNELFYKEIQNSGNSRLNGKGEKLLSRPNLVFDKNYKSFKLVLPKQILKRCTADEYPTWYISISGNLFTKIEPELMQGKASLYTKECEIDIYKKDLYNDFNIVLKSDIRDYYRRTIKEDDCRFFNKKNRCVDLELDFLPKDVNVAFVKKDKQIKYVNGSFDDVEVFDEDSDIFTFSPSEGDVFVLPNNHAIPVGEILKEGLIGNSLVSGVRAIEEDGDYEITSIKERLFFKANDRQLKGSSIRVSSYKKEVYFGKILPEDLVEFSLGERIDDVYGYIIDFHQYIKKDGVYRIELNIPGNGIRNYNICYIKDFEFTFVNAPYVFEETGEISFPTSLRMEKNNEWIVGDNKQSYVFSLNESNRNNNESVINRKLYLNYVGGDNKIRLEFDIPAFYWKYNPKDNWEYRKPNDINYKDLPKRVYISGNFDVKNSSMYIENGEDLEISEITCSYDREEKAYYFRTVDISSNLNKEKVARLINIRIENVIVKFLKVVCRSFVVSRNVTGDFENNKLFGNYDIVGSSEYVASVYYGENKIDDNIQVVNGLFELDHLIEEGSYKVELYEIEDDGSGFDLVSFKIDEHSFELFDAGRLSGKTAKIESIGDREAKLTPLSLVPEYRIEKLKKVSYDSLLEDDTFYSWLYDVEDYEIVSRFVYYTGFLNSIERNQEVKRIGRCLLIFDNIHNIGEALINIYDNEEGYTSLIYSPNKRRLLANDGNLTKYERKRAFSIDDDIYRIKISVR